MRFLVFFALIFLCFSKKGKIVDLTKKNFNQVKQSKGLWLNLFYAPWCGHCKALKPHFEKAAEKIGDIVNFGRINCDDEKELCGKYGIQGFPTMKFFMPDGKVKDYQNQRTTKAIADESLKFFRKIKSPVVDVNGEEIENDPKLHTAILFSEKKTQPNLFKSIALESPGIKFAFVSLNKDKNKIPENFQIKETPAIVVLKPGEGHIVYEGEINKKDIKKFLSKYGGEEVEKDDVVETPKAEPKQRKKPKPVEREPIAISSQEKFEIKCKKFCVLGAYKDEENEKLFKEIVKEYPDRKNWEFLKIKKDFESKNKFWNLFEIEDSEYKENGLDIFIIRLKREKQIKLTNVNEIEKAKTFFERIIGGNMKYETLKEVPTIFDKVIVEEEVEETEEVEADL